MASDETETTLHVVESDDDTVQATHFILMYLMQREGPFEVNPDEMDAIREVMNHKRLSLIVRPDGGLTVTTEDRELEDE